MVYRVLVFDRNTDEQLSSHWVGVEDLTAFLQQFLTKDTKIVLLDDYYNN